MSAQIFTFHALLVLKALTSIPKLGDLDDTRREWIPDSRPRTPLAAAQLLFVKDPQLGVIAVERLQHIEAVREARPAVRFGIADWLFMGARQRCEDKT